MATDFAQGKFYCRVVGQGLSVAKSGNEQFWIQVEPIGQINPADPESPDLLRCPQGKTRTIYRAITDKTIDWIKRDLEYLMERSGKSGGIGGFEYLDPNTPGYVDFTNAEVEATCDHEDYQGKTQERWNLASGTGMQAKPLEEKSVRKLNAMFGKELRSIGGEAPKRQPAKVQKPSNTVAPYLNEGEAIPEDSIPF